MELLLIIPIAWWWCNFEPLQATLTEIYMSLRLGTWAIPLLDALSCSKCVAFWLTLAWHHDFILACQAALGAYILELCLNKLT
jgi:hypothetical protein